MKRKWSMLFTLVMCLFFGNALTVNAEEVPIGIVQPDVNTLMQMESARLYEMYGIKVTVTDFPTPEENYQHILKIAKLLDSCHAGSIKVMAERIKTDSVKSAGCDITGRPYTTPEEKTVKINLDKDYFYIVYPSGYTNTLKVNTRIDKEFLISGLAQLLSFSVEDYLGPESSDLHKKLLALNNGNEWEKCYHYSVGIPEQDAMRGTQPSCFKNSLAAVSQDLDFGITFSDVYWNTTAGIMSRPNVDPLYLQKAIWIKDITNEMLGVEILQ